MPWQLRGCGRLWLRCVTSPWWWPAPPGSAGDQLLFGKVVAVARAVVRRDGRIQAGGHPACHARLGALEQQLDELAGPVGLDYSIWLGLASLAGWDHR